MCPRKNWVCPVFGKESREVLTVGRSLGPSSPLSVRFEGGLLARPRQPGTNVFTAVGTGWRRLGRCGGRAVGRMGVTALAGRVTSWSCQSTWFWMRDTQPIDGCLLQREWWRRRRMDSGTRGRMGGRWIAEKNLLPESEIGIAQRCCGRVVGVCKRSQDELSCHSKHDRDRPGNNDSQASGDGAKHLRAGAHHLIGCPSPLSTVVGYPVRGREGRLYPTPENSTFTP